MNAILIQIMQIVIIPILPLVGVLLSVLLRKYINRIQQQIKNEEINQYIDILEDMISNIVIELNQTLVDALKEAQGGKLTPEQQRAIFITAKDKVMKQLTDAQRKALQEVYGDLDKYINTLIEASVNAMKAPK